MTTMAKCSGWLAVVHPISLKPYAVVYAPRLCTRAGVQREPPGPKLRAESGHWADLKGRNWNYRRDLETPTFFSLTSHFFLSRAPFPCWFYSHHFSNVPVAPLRRPPLPEEHHVGTHHSLAPAPPSFSCNRPHTAVMFSYPRPLSPWLRTITSHNLNAVVPHPHIPSSDMCAITPRSDAFRRPYVEYTTHT